MRNFEAFFIAVLKDLKVELDDEFDRNFERKAFFDQQWPQTKWANSKGSLLNRSGIGRRSISSKITGGDSIVWTSSVDYMATHNEGGEVTITQKMIRFFWAMHYKASGAISKKKSGEQANTQRNRKLTNEAAIWKALALQKPGSKMKIPRRRFIGDHPHVDAAVKRVTDINVKQLESDLKQILNPKK
jgi:phage gpG-like protein